MARVLVKLMLEVEKFDESLYLPIFAHCESMGVRFETMHSLGDLSDARLALYELNKTCSGAKKVTMIILPLRNMVNSGLEIITIPGALFWPYRGMNGSA